MLEPVVLEHKPDVVLVYGDVNSTVAAALVCAKLLVPVGHVEAGLRSRDRRMPEEINRLVTDQLADLLFTPSREGDENLLNYIETEVNDGKLSIRPKKNVTLRSKNKITVYIYLTKMTGIYVS
ncbi:MAG: UDP-N-acetylglucosamine 2-epimerase, partial [Acidobacteriota bacterium]|nr:UDP-N-acetylglucosamine 2-epimerase [Acidobacteriota bacterium]